MILLSFDTEEFDGPREHGVEYSLEEGMKVSVEGTNRILDVLKVTMFAQHFSVQEISPKMHQRQCRES